MAFKLGSFGKTILTDSGTIPFNVGGFADFTLRDSSSASRDLTENLRSPLEPSSSSDYGTWVGDAWQIYGRYNVTQSSSLTTPHALRLGPDNDPTPYDRIKIVITTFNSSATDGSEEDDDNYPWVRFNTTSNSFASGSTVHSNALSGSNYLNMGIGARAGTTSAQDFEYTSDRIYFQSLSNGGQNPVQAGSWVGIIEISNNLDPDVPSTMTMEGTCHGFNSTGGTVCRNWQGYYIYDHADGLDPIKWLAFGMTGGTTGTTYSQIDMFAYFTESRLPTLTRSLEYPSNPILS